MEQQQKSKIKRLNSNSSRRKTKSFAFYTTYTQKQSDHSQTNEIQTKTHLKFFSYAQVKTQKTKKTINEIPSFFIDVSYLKHSKKKKKEFVINDQTLTLTIEKK